jgi:hypothetical protein
LRPKTIRLLFDYHVRRKRRKKKFIFFSLLDKWTTYFTNLLKTPYMPNSNFVWAYGEFLFKMDRKFILPIFWRAPICSHVAKVAQGLKDRIPKKKFVLPIQSYIILGIQFFSIFVFAHGSAECHVQYNCSYMSMKILNLVTKFYKFYNICCAPFL